MALRVGVFRRFRFVQWEFAGRLGPPPGRYVVRRFAGDDVREVIVVSLVPPPTRRRRREPPDVTRVTVIDAAPVPDDATAAAWLRGFDDSSEALAIFSRFMAFHRVAAADPFAPDADPAKALAIRAGYGSGEQLAAGEWTEAKPLPAPSLPTERRRSKHRPADRLAALLSGRDAVLACEELTLRCRADLDLGRNREAALQLEAALSAGLSELSGWVTLGDLAERLSELGGLSAAVAAAGVAARSGTLSEADVEVVSRVLSRLEAALRARAIHAAES